jgi:hypothetical protein
MKYLLKCMFCVLALIPTMPAQQVGYVDLVSPPPLLTKPQPDKSLPAGCSSLGGGFADGFAKPDDGKEREITLEIIKLSSTTLTMK